MTSLVDNLKKTKFRTIEIVGGENDNIIYFDKTGNTGNNTKTLKLIKKYDLDINEFVLNKYINRASDGELEDLAHLRRLLVRYMEEDVEYLEKSKNSTSKETTKTEPETTIVNPAIGDLVHMLNEYKIKATHDEKTNRIIIDYDGKKSEYKIREISIAFFQRLNCGIVAMPMLCHCIRVKHMDIEQAIELTIASAINEDIRLHHENIKLQQEMENKSKTDQIINVSAIETIEKKARLDLVLDMTEAILNWLKPKPIQK
jgi:hypothetical protein